MSAIFYSTPIQRFDDPRKFKMMVECIYVSEQVLRFKINAGQREMIMEKSLLKRQASRRLQKWIFNLKVMIKALQWLL